MSSFSQQDGDKENYQFKAKTDNAKNVLQILKTVNFRDMATVILGRNGVKVIVEESKCVQANAFVEAALFQELETEEDMLTFRINLSVWVECLGIFGRSGISGLTPSLKMYYAGYGSPLILELEEGGVVTDCKINTEEVSDTLDFEFLATGVVNKIIMRSELLKEVFSELDMTSEVLEILTSPDPPHFRLSTFGNHGTNHTDIPKESEMVQIFSCTKTISQRYRLSLLKHAIKPLAAAVKVSIRTDARGFLGLQFMVKLDNNHTCYMEYFCCPDEDTSD